MHSFLVLLFEPAQIRLGLDRTRVCVCFPTGGSSPLRRLCNAAVPPPVTLRRGAVKGADGDRDDAVGAPRTAVCAAPTTPPAVQQGDDAISEPKCAPRY